MKFSIWILSLFFALSSTGQDINFSQFYELPLLRNPALAGGFNGDIRITTAYRNQWQSVTTPYKTQALGAEFKLSASENSDNYFAFGLQITNDVAGDSKLGKTQLLPVLTFHKSISEDGDGYLSAGFSFGPVQQRFDPTDLKFDDQFVNGAYSPTNPTQQTFSNTNCTYWDASTGLLFSSSINEVKFYIGASYYHFNQPKVAFSSLDDIRLNKKIMINAGLSVPTSDDDKVIVYTDYFKQGGNSQMQGGIMFRHSLIEEDDESIALTGGVFTRWNDAVIPMIKLEYYELGIGLTYDVNMSKLKNASEGRGGFEATLSYRSFLNMRNSSLQKTKCPARLY